MTNADFALIVFGICVTLISQTLVDSITDSPDRRSMLSLFADFVTAIIVATALILLLVGVPR